MVHRIKCRKCDNMILPQTATDNDGLCGVCAKSSRMLSMFPEEICTKVENEKAEYDRRLREGLVFTPSESELDGALTPRELTDSATRWKLQPEFYAERSEASPNDAISQARREIKGNVFLVSDADGQLNLGFTARLAVLEYQNEGDEHLRCAYSLNKNLRSQVSEDDQVVQACPCCGVGLLWYPSRYHMPREFAFAILESAMKRAAIAEVAWLETDDFSYADCGVG